MTPAAPSAQAPTSARQLPWFLAVGASAAAVHMGVVAVAVPVLALSPLWANVLGWCVAFWVSWAGHHFLTFAHRGQTASAAQSLPRFLAVSAAGFALNHVCYAALLRWTPLHYTLALALVLIGVAVLTFVVSRWWAFART